MFNNRGLLLRKCEIVYSNKKTMFREIGVKLHETKEFRLSAVYDFNSMFTAELEGCCNSLIAFYIQQTFLHRVSLNKKQTY